STRSLWAQDLDYRELHGRRYCRDYFMPNDDMEQLRMTLLHRVYLHVLNNELTTVPLNNPEHILDIGTGTGEWAIRVAELFPLCEVVGTDISATAETQGVPMNVFFEVEDAEEWERLPDLYDLIHFRDMEGAFGDWAAMYANVYYSLKPGGYVEVQDFDSVEGLSKFFAQFSPDSSVHALQRDLLLASEKAGRTRGTSHMHPRVFLDAGFVDVRATEYAIPISVAEKTAGKIWLIACLDAWEAMCLRLLTEQMDWDPDECKAACEEAARELANLAKDPEKSKGLQVKMVVVTARKP
ncbi:S-adenosyl-L-methionine-dependent methyltransferase, partial [Sarocladium strictum]